MTTFRTGFLLAVVLLATESFGQAQDRVRWQWDVHQAQEQAATSGRLVVLHFYTRSCQPCAKLDRDVFSQPGFAEALEADFIPVKINADDLPSLATRYGITSVPTDVVIAASGRIVAKTRCPQTADQYLANLRQIADADRRIAAPGAAADRGGPDRGGTSRADAGQDVAARSTLREDPQARLAGAAVRGGDNGRDVYDDPTPSPTAAGRRPPQDASVRGGSMDGQPSQPKLPYGDVTRQSGFAPPQPAAVPMAPSQPTRSEPTASSTSANRVPPSPSQEGRPPVPGSTTGPPPIGLDGYCPVRLTEQEQWVPGDRRFGAIHRGRTYLFAGLDEQRRFLADPDRYSPVLSGFDPVYWSDRSQLVSGRREFGVVYQKHVFLFNNPQSLATFRARPADYAGRVEQALRPTRNMRR